MSTQPYGYIYKTTFPDGKYYIGQSSGGKEKKNYFGSGRYILNFVKHNGTSQLKRDILVWVFGGQKELNEEECRILGDKYKTDYLCVNLRPGGNRGGASEAFRERMRAINTGRRATVQTRRKLSEMRVGAGNNFYGRKHTEETKNKMRKPHRTYRGIPIVR